MKKIVYVFLFISIIVQSPRVKAQSNDIAQLGPFAVGYEFCQNVQSIAPILQSYSNVQWPVIGAPGVTFGLVQNESALMKICDYLVQLQSLTTEGAIFSSARFLNELTGNKWDDHLAQAELTWDIANSLYDFRSGQGREGALESAATHRRLVNFADQTAQWYQKSWGSAKNGGPAEGIEEKHERKRKLQKVAQLSYQRAILSEASRCPNPRVNTDYQKEYTDEIVPEEHNKKEKSNNVQYYFTQLMRMGTDFINEVSEMQAYRNELENLIDNGYSYTATTGRTRVKRNVPTGKVKKTDESFTGTAPEVKEENISREYQKVRVITNQIVWTEFRNKYSPLWEEYIEREFFSFGTEGLLNGKKGRIEAKYRSYAFECSEVQLQRSLPVRDRNDPRYWPQLKRQQELCYDNLKKRDVQKNQFANLFERYLFQMQRDLSSAKLSQAKIWTFESLYFGVTPITEDTLRANDAKNNSEAVLGGIQKPDEDCRPDFTPAEMNKMGIELQNVQNAFMEEIVSTETQREVKKEIQEEASRKTREELENNMDKELEKSNSTVKPSTPPLDMRPRGGV